jgi:hypothetical protein
MKTNISRGRKNNGKGRKLIYEVAHHNIDSAKKQLGKGGIKL